MDPARSSRVDYPLDKLIERVDYILREWKDESNLSCLSGVFLRLVEDCLKLMIIVSRERHVPVLKRNFCFDVNGRFGLT